MRNEKGEEEKCPMSPTEHFHSHFIGQRSGSWPHPTTPRLQRRSKPTEPPKCPPSTRKSWGRRCLPKDRRQSGPCPSGPSRLHTSRAYGASCHVLEMRAFEDGRSCSPAPARGHAWDKEARSSEKKGVPSLPWRGHGPEGTPVHPGRRTMGDGGQCGQRGIH